MFPKKILLCVDSPEDFQIYKSEVGWVTRHLRCSLVLFHSVLMKWSDVLDDQELMPFKEPSIEHLVDDPALHSIEVEVKQVETTKNLIDSILGAVAETGADMVLVPTHGRSGFDRWVFGSVAERVVRSCRVPVLTLDLKSMPRRQDEAAFDHVIVPVDFSEVSERAIPHAVELANRCQASMTLFHVVDAAHSSVALMGGFPSSDNFIPQLIRQAEQKLERLATKWRTKVEHDLDTSLPVGGLTDEARLVSSQHRNPLVVLATAGRDSLGDFFLGSRAERLIRTMKCSILSLPQTFLQN